MKLNRDTFDTMKSMLESPDKENAILGLTAIEELDFKENLIYILLLAKEANMKDAKLWLYHAKNTYDMFHNQGIDLLLPITFNQILEKAGEYKAVNEDVQFIMDRYAASLLKSINTFLRPEVAIKKITIKIDDYDDKSGTVGKNIQGSHIGGALLRDVPNNVE